MINYHKEKNSDFTIAVIEVPWEEASNFGIMNTDEDGRIIEFEEKPARPKNNYASMGIYVANWGLLKEYLDEDERDRNSNHDFGKNVIPKMLNSGRGMYAYPFKGYWRDVGTIESLWDAHMDLLHSRPGLDLYDYEWRIYSKNPTQPAHFVASTARVTSSLINEGCFVFGSVENSILFPGVHVSEGVEISNSIIMPNVKIGPHTILHKTIIGESATIQDYCRIGRQDDHNARCRGITVIEGGITVPRGAVITGGIQVHEENLHEFYSRNRGEVK